MRMLLHHIRAWISRPVRAAAVFPNSTFVGRIAESLSFVRSTYDVFLFNTPWDRTFELCIRGYGPFVADAVGALSDRFMFLDIGANVGLFSLLAARNPNCVSVIAFEPVAETFSNLQRNIAYNGADGIRPILGAITGRDGPVVYITYSRRHSGMSKIIAGVDGVRTAPVVSRSP